MDKLNPNDLARLIGSLEAYAKIAKLESQWMPQTVFALLDELERAAERNVALGAELEQCQKDAERYRWLKEQWHGFQHYRDSTGTVANVDREIDEAIAVCNWKPMAKEGGANG